MTDRGLRSPKLWKKISSLGWHPYMRQSVNATFRLSAATPLTLAAGSRVIVGVFRLGLATLSRLLTKGRVWRGVWLLPEPWPPPDGLKVVLRHET